MADAKVVILVGSLRDRSVSKQIAQAAVENPPQGVVLEVRDGLEKLPFYSEELDSSEYEPVEVAGARTAIADADAVLVVTPEYNGSFPAVIKNVIDWGSRPYGKGALKDKPFAVITHSISGRAGQWANADTRRSAAVAGALVSEDLRLELGPTGDLFDGRHPREHDEIVAKIGALVGDLVAAEAPAAV